MLPPLMLTINF